RAGNPFVGTYLVGRAKLADPPSALPWLDQAAERLAGVDSPALEAETLGLRAEALTRVGRLDEAAAAWKTIAALPGVAGDVRDRAADGLARVEWKRVAKSLSG